jgi:hypothetical protein
MRLASVEVTQPGILLAGRRNPVGHLGKAATNRRAHHGNRVWRTDVEESETAGYITPALLVSPPDQAGERNVTPAAVAVTVRATTTICRSPDEGDNSGEANTTTTLGVERQPESKRGDQ